MLSVTMLVPDARASATAICGCISVGYPGYGKVFTCVLRSFFAEITRTASSNSSTSHPISSNLAVIASRCFGITFLIRISPRVGRCSEHICSCLDHIRHNRIICTVQHLHTSDTDHTVPGTLDIGTHAVQEVCCIYNVWLFCLHFQ